ncbi:MAG: DNA mismatch repair protein MutS [bacterium]|nr:DNA mismatch repair protein MutS [bacterium]MBU1917217.1 DNA mismatch repair protein MutS [bacterium]
MAETQKNTESPKKIKLTPMMRQYVEIKSEHEDSILMYRLGDFYEMFYDDAKEASELLDITLTTRNKSSDNPVPLCGVPYHAVEGYISKLVSKGKKVVICDQVEDPKLAKGIVKREVTRVVSPGIIMEDQSLSARTNNYLMCMLESSNVHRPSSIVYSLCDVSTGQLEYARVDSIEALIDEIARLDIRELVYIEKDGEAKYVQKILSHYSTIYHKAQNDLFCDTDYAGDLLKEQFSISSLEALNLTGEQDYISVLGLLLGHLNDNKILQSGLLKQPVERQLTSHMVLDESTIRNLELFRTLRDDGQQGTLLWHLDHCGTTMGSRKLAEVMRAPLMDKKEIDKRLATVEEFIKHEAMAESLGESLKSIADIERLSNRFITGSANARDAVSLKQSFYHLPEIKECLAHCESRLLQELGKELYDFTELAKQIDQTIVEEPPLTVREGRMICDGVHDELDELRAIEKSGKGYIAQMEAKEREKTGISSLKIRYNNVFGYYMEVTNTHKDKVPETYVRKQTLTNAERYINDELKQYEQKVLGASERIKRIEYDIFSVLKAEIAAACDEMKQTASALAMIDVLHAFAWMARKYHYTKPSVTTETVLDLRDARHPILERLNIGENYIPNDLFLDALQNCELIITGPNMAGKSTVMRMAGLVTIMAQMGSFVPCGKATIGICDRVFTRVGAHDHLQKGMSTFMVEMVETSRILREATARSLILLDEIGRGTSTFDGLSIAWAVAEDIHDRLHARTLFATHYHQLCDLAEQKKGVKNYHMAVREWNGEIIFLRKLKTGATNRSYGVVVASMAGLPPQAVKRAKEILKLLELKDLSFQSDLERDSTGQLGLFEQKETLLVLKIKALDLNQLTPIDALNFLHEIKAEIK